MLVLSPKRHNSWETTRDLAKWLWLGVVLFVEGCASTEGAREPARVAPSPQEPAVEEKKEPAVFKSRQRLPELDPSAIDHKASGAIVVLGSSTAAGVGPKLSKNTWVNRYRAYLAKEFPNFSLTNLAVSGYTTYHVQPSDYLPPPGRPTPKPAKNITAALALSPSAIIINLPSNDIARGYAFEEQIENFERLSEIAAVNGVPLWVTTPQPRNFEVPLQLSELFTLRVALTYAFEKQLIDFWTNIAVADGTLVPEYDSGDGLHLNDAAHALLAERVIASKIPEYAVAMRSQENASAPLNSRANAPAP